MARSRQPRNRIGATLRRMLVLGLLAVAGAAITGPATAQDHHHDRRDHRPEHAHWERQSHYYEPPVVVRPGPSGYYAPPPVVPAPPSGLNIVLPIHIR